MTPARKAYLRAYQRQWMAKRRAEFFTGRCCIKCGSTSNLELDHKQRDTKISHCIWSWSEVRRNEELAKCQVLCKECHREKTNAENSLLYRYNAPEGQAWCCMCKAFRGIEFFRRNRSRWNGLSGDCRNCDSKRKGRSFNRKIRQAATPNRLENGETERSEELDPLIFLHS